MVSRLSPLAGPRKKCRFSDKFGVVSEQIFPLRVGVKPDGFDNVEEVEIWRFR